MPAARPAPWSFVAALAAIAAVAVAEAAGMAWPLLLLLAAAGALTVAAIVEDRRRRARQVEMRSLRTALDEQRLAVEEQRDELATLVAELADGVLIAGPDERIRLANPAAERILAAGTLVGRRTVEVVRDHELLAALSRARVSGEAVADIERTGPRRALRAVARSLAGGDLLLTIQDLSALRQAERVRRDFVANVSHELRTPIASLKAMAETLEQGALDDPAAARDFVGRMHREIDEMAQLVSELLALARAESGSERLALRPVAPVDLLRDAVRRAGPLAERAGIQLALEERDDLPAVNADPDRVGQVLANLLHNAVKFTPVGGSVRVWAEPEGAAVRFVVRDSGAGIPVEDLGRIFERFYKGDRARAGGGTGLGLAIAKHLVQAHGGEIAAASDGPGTGATFSFRLPAA